MAFSEYYRYYIVKFDIDGNQEWIINDARFYHSLLLENDGFVIAFGGVEISLIKVDFDWNVMSQDYLDIMQNVGSIINTTDGYIVSDFAIQSYITLADGFIAVCNSDPFWSFGIKCFDFELNEIWSLNQKYQDEKGYFNATDLVTMVRVDDVIYAAGHTSTRAGQPFVLKIDLDGNILWESGLLENKGEVHQAIGIYEFNGEVWLHTMYYDYNLQPYTFESMKII